MKKTTILLIILNLLIFGCKNNSTQINHFEILNLSELKTDSELNIGMLVLDFGEIEGNDNVSKIIKVKNISGEEISFNEQKLLTKAITFDWGNEIIKPDEIRELTFTINPSLIEGKGMSTIQLTSDTGTVLMFEYSYETHNKTLKYSIIENKLKISESGNYTFEIKNIGFNITEMESNNENAVINYPKNNIEPNKTEKITVDFSKGNIEIKNTKIILKIDKVTKWSQNIPGMQTEKEITLTIEE